jgi:hypothetical protein
VEIKGIADWTWREDGFEVGVINRKALSAFGKWP